MGCGRYECEERIKRGAHGTDGCIFILVVVVAAAAVSINSISRHRILFLSPGFYSSSILCVFFIHIACIDYVLSIGVRFVTKL